MSKPIIDQPCICGTEIPQGSKRYCSDQCQATAYILRKREKRVHEHRHKFRCTGCGEELSLGRPEKGVGPSPGMPLERLTKFCQVGFRPKVPLRASGGGISKDWGEDQYWLVSWMVQ